MSRPCGPCGDPRRNELDRRLLEKDISGESFRRIAADFDYSETALRRHLNEHLVVDLENVYRAKQKAKAESLEKIKAEELERTTADAKNSMASRLENAASFFDQLKEIRRKSADLLDRAERSNDLKSAGTFLKELREQIRLWAELDGKLAAQPQINILMTSEWIELRTLIITALDPYPEAKEAMVRAIRGR